jgi:hypothetical protein
MSFIQQSLDIGVYELLQNYFVLDDFINDFDLIFEICEHITRGHVPPLVSHLLITSRPLVLEKQIRGVQPLVIGKVIY